GPHALAVVQWPFALGAAAAAAALARAIGFRRASVWAAALVLGTPMVLFQSQLDYTDVVALFGVAVAAPMVVRCARCARMKGALANGAVGGLALSIVLGAKYAALPLIAALVPVLFVYALAPDGHAKLRRLPRALAIVGMVGVFALVPSWFWFARNLRLA